MPSSLSYVGSSTKAMDKNYEKQTFVRHVLGHKCDYELSKL
jgi:hypothetical protein